MIRHLQEGKGQTTPQAVSQVPRRIQLHGQKTCEAVASWEQLRLHWSYCVVGCVLQTHLMPWLLQLMSTSSKLGK